MKLKDDVLTVVADSITVHTGVVMYFPHVGQQSCSGDKTSVTKLTFLFHLLLFQLLGFTFTLVRCCRWLSLVRLGDMSLFNI